MCKKEVNKHVVCEKGLITVFWVYFIGKLRLYAKDVNNSFGRPLEEEEQTHNTLYVGDHSLLLTSSYI
jgi:hypothetical protein